jgi:hypothetical protein
MAGRRAQAKRQVTSYARLDVFARGQIRAYHASGKSRDEICSLLTKTDGSNPQIRAVNYIVSKKRKQPDWRGESISEGGRRRKLDKGEVFMIFAVALYCWYEFPGFSLNCNTFTRRGPGFFAIGGGVNDFR